LLLLACTYIIHAIKQTAEMKGTYTLNQPAT
jgi:hypothetical protein